MKHYTYKRTSFLKNSHQQVFPFSRHGNFQAKMHFIINFYKVSHQHQQKNLSMAEENAKENV